MNWGLAQFPTDYSSVIVAINRSAATPAISFWELMETTSETVTQRDGVHPTLEN